MLGCVILVTTNSRLIIENLLKYGLLYNPVAFIKSAVPPAGNLPLLCCWPALVAFAGAALAIERLGALRVHFERKVRVVHRSTHCICTYLLIDRFGVAAHCTLSGRSVLYKVLQSYRNELPEEVTAAGKVPAMRDVWTMPRWPAAPDIPAAAVHRFCPQHCLFPPMQAVKSRNNKDMSPALAKRKRQAMARITEVLRNRARVG